jgi:hypothetical protein
LTIKYIHEAVRSLQLLLPFEAARRVVGYLPSTVCPGQKGVFQEQGETHQHFALAHGLDRGFDQIRHLG